MGALRQMSVGPREAVNILARLRKTRSIEVFGLFSYVNHINSVSENGLYRSAFHSPIVIADLRHL